MKHSKEELRQWQSLPLSVKIRMTEERIRDWVNEYGEDDVYISFSGGKDSTVLLDIARKRYPDLKAMFVDVPTQYPELRSFVKSFDNVDIVSPKINFRQVCEEYGFPLISKEVSLAVFEVRRAIKNGKEAPAYRMEKFNNEKLDDSGNLSSYNMPQYKFLLDAPFDISHKCCNVMKKSPAKQYEKATGRHPITAQMAEESRLRQSNWLKNGCNMYDLNRPISNPMSFWTEQDILKYIRDNELEICSVYGKVMTDDEISGQLSFDIGQTEHLQCSGCQRTGCVLCGFGAQSKDDNRYLKLKESHPQMYDMLDVVTNNGYTMRQAIEWINEHGKLKNKIKI